MPTTPDIKAYICDTLCEGVTGGRVVEEEDGAGGMCEEDQVGLTVRLLIGAFIPRSQRGGEANQ